MKLLFFFLFLSLSGNKPSENGIPYRPLTWSDFRGQVPDTEIYVAARTCTQLSFETTETGGKFYFRVKALFLPDSSFVRIRSEETLYHEQTHFKIAYIASLQCMRSFAPLQGGDSTDKVMAQTLYDHFVEESGRLNDRFDRETNHSLDHEAELQWEDWISHKLHILESSKPIHGRKR